MRKIVAVIIVATGLFLASVTIYVVKLAKEMVKDER